MSIIEALLQEFEQEVQTTRRVLERVPADKLAWKPHDKSMSLGKLALHVATSPAFITDWAVQDVVTMSGGNPPDPTTTKEILDAHDAGATKTKSNLSSIGDANMGKM